MGSTLEISKRESVKCFIVLALAFRSEVTTLLVAYESRTAFLLSFRLRTIEGNLAAPNNARCCSFQKGEVSVGKSTSLISQWNFTVGRWLQVRSSATVPLDPQSYDSIFSVARDQNVKPDRVSSPLNA
jgi:hypothetical protein